EELTLNPSGQLRKQEENCTLTQNSQQ
ncbi:hypothetical protein CCACVL1_19226, partial [Corchorus capsularis]